MPKVYYGCDHVPRGWGRYYGLCNAIELDIESFEKEPKVETLNRWRVDSPRGFAFIPHSRKRFIAELARLSRSGAETVDEAAREAWEACLTDAKALAAKAILVKTPLSFSPSPSNRRLMESFGNELARSAKAAVIWESQGMWPVEESRDLARRAHMVYAYDPFLAIRDKMEPTHGDACFVLTERAGMRRQFDEYDLEELLDWAHNYDRIFTLLRGRFQWQHARLFKSFLADQEG
jgi:uncharacterized protein YecE (DUF72 family)